MNKVMTIEWAATLYRYPTVRTETKGNSLFRYIYNNYMRECEHANIELTDKFNAFLPESVKCLVTIDNDSTDTYYCYVPSPYSNKTFCISYSYEESLKFFDRYGETVPKGMFPTDKTVEERRFIEMVLEKGMDVLLHENQYRLLNVTGQIHTRPLVKS